ncbi:MAG: hypothetical protein EOL90_10285 [Spartobacteria bacterium]|nr:hypothetical protein [Spartobacteria bacterium]
MLDLHHVVAPPDSAAGFADTSPSAIFKLAYAPNKRKHDLGLLLVFGYGMSPDGPPTFREVSKAFRKPIFRPPSSQTDILGFVRPFFAFFEPRAVPEIM